MSNCIDKAKEIKKTSLTSDKIEFPGFSLSSKRKLNSFFKELVEMGRVR